MAEPLAARVALISGRSRTCRADAAIAGRRRRAAQGRRLLALDEGHNVGRNDLRS
jgi:hypothetical protein